MIMYALIGGAVFYAHARISFAEPKVMSWLMSHSTRAMSGDTTACDDYTDDVEVVLTASGRSGRWEVEGGKNELCGYLRQAAAAFTVLQARVDTRYEDIEITPASFPWMDASVSYTQITDVRVGGAAASDHRNRGYADGAPGAHGSEDQRRGVGVHGRLVSACYRLLPPRLTQQAHAIGHHQQAGAHVGKHRHPQRGQPRQ
jgi:hypothetical protein